MCRWDAGGGGTPLSLVAACISITHYSLDILITYCHMTHTYRALGVGTLNGIREGGLFISLPSGASGPLLNFKLHIDIEGSREGTS